MWSCSFVDGQAAALSDHGYKYVCLARRLPGIPLCEHESCHEPCGLDQDCATWRLPDWETLHPTDLHWQNGELTIPRFRTSRNDTTLELSRHVGISRPAGAHQESSGKNGLLRWFIERQGSKDPRLSMHEKACVHYTSVACHIPGPEIPIELKIGFSSPIAPSPGTLSLAESFSCVSAGRCQGCFTPQPILPLPTWPVHLAHRVHLSLFPYTFPLIKLHIFEPGVSTEGLVCPCLAQIVIRISNISVGQRGRLPCNPSHSLVTSPPLRTPPSRHGTLQCLLSLPSTPHTHYPEHDFHPHRIWHALPPSCRCICALPLACPAYTSPTLHAEQLRHPRLWPLSASYCADLMSPPLSQLGRVPKLS